MSKAEVQHLQFIELLLTCKKHHENNETMALRISTCAAISNQDIWLKMFENIYKKIPNKSCANSFFFSLFFLS